jgi:hypothetical protein
MKQAVFDYTKTGPNIFDGQNADHRDTREREEKKIDPRQKHCHDCTTMLDTEDGEAQLSDACE